MLDKHLEINHKIHNLLAETFNTLVSKYHISQDDCTKLYDTLDEVDSLVKSKGILVATEPPTKPTSKDIIRAMHKSGITYVPCWASDLDEHPTRENVWVFVHFVHDKFYLDDDGTQWKYATPFDHTSGREITEIPE